jgi:hypothetical protein
MGQYLYVEILAGLPLTAAMAELLGAGRSAVRESWPAPEAIRSTRTIAEPTVERAVRYAEYPVLEAR